MIAFLSHDNKMASCSLLCSPRLHLFGQKHKINEKIALLQKYPCSIFIYFVVQKMFCFLVKTIILIENNY